MIRAILPSSTQFGASCQATIFKRSGISIGADNSITVQVGGYVDEVAASDGVSQPVVYGSTILTQDQIPALAAVLASLDAILVQQDGPWKGGTIVADTSN